MQTDTCPNCGEPVKGRFCTSCGTRLDAPAASPAQNLNSVSDAAEATSMMRPSYVQSALSKRSEQEEPAANATAETPAMSDTENGVSEMEGPAPARMEGEGVAGTPSGESSVTDDSEPERRPSLWQRLMAFLFPRSAGDASR